MGEQQSGHEPGDEPIENEYGSLARPEEAALHELTAEVRAASQQLYEAARAYAARPVDIEDEALLAEFMQELQLVDLPKEQLIQALEYACERAESDTVSGKANSMDPFLDDIHPEHEAEEVRTGHAERALHSSRAAILLLLSVRKLLG